MKFSEKVLLSQKIDKWIEENKIDRSTHGVLSILDIMGMLKEKDDKKYIMLRETLAQSILSDLVTFGSLVFCIYISRGNVIWTTVCVVFMLVFVLGHTKLRDRQVFNSKKELQEYLDQN